MKELIVPLAHLFSFRTEQLSPSGAEVILSQSNLGK